MSWASFTELFVLARMNLFSDIHSLLVEIRIPPLMLRVDEEIPALRVHPRYANAHNCL